MHSAHLQWHLVQACFYPLPLEIMLLTNPNIDTFSTLQACFSPWGALPRWQPCLCARSRCVADTSFLLLVYNSNWEGCGGAVYQYLGPWTTPALHCLFLILPCISFKPSRLWRCRSVSIPWTCANFARSFPVRARLRQWTRSELQSTWKVKENAF